MHRSLCPHAIVLPEGRLLDATIADFNLIKAAHLGLNPSFDDAMIDRAYCAPEQSSTSGIVAKIGPWTDIYSLALVILTAVTGKTPNERETSPDLSPLARNLRPVFEKMLERSPAKRFQSMDEVVKHLDLARDAAPLQSVLNRALSVRLPRIARSTAAEPVPVPAARPTPAPARVVPPAKAPPVARATVAYSPPTQAPRPRPTPPPPIAARPSPAAPLGKFHESRSSLNFGALARRTAAGVSALLLAASPWMFQTSWLEGPADASTVAPATKGQPAVSPRAGVERALRSFALLPKGRVYGADNTFSQVTLRIHRPTRVSVYARNGRVLFNRAVQPGDIYHAPSLPNLSLTAEDGGAVEVLYDGSSTGFIGQDGVALERAKLNAFASAAPPRPKPPATQPKPAPAIEQAPPPVAAGDDGSALASLIPPAPEIEIITEPAEPPAQAPEAAPPAVARDEGPEPPAWIEVTPRATRGYVEIPLPSPPATEAEAPRTGLLGRLAPRLSAAPTPVSEPAVSKQAADRAKNAADMAKAARDAAREKAAREARGRERAFFNSALGVSTPY
jgi:hypothetical protein